MNLLRHIAFTSRLIAHSILLFLPLMYEKYSHTLIFNLYYRALCHVQFYTQYVISYVIYCTFSNKVKLFACKHDMWGKNII